MGVVVVVCGGRGDAPSPSHLSSPPVSLHAALSLFSPSPLRLSPFRRSESTDNDEKIRAVRTAQYNERRKEENVDCKSRRCWIIGILYSPSLSTTSRFLFVYLSSSRTYSSLYPLTLSQDLLFSSLAISTMASHPFSPIDILIYQWMGSFTRTSLDSHRYSPVRSVAYLGLSPAGGSLLMAALSLHSRVHKALWFYVPKCFHDIYEHSFKCPFAVERSAEARFKHNRYTIVAGS